MKKLICSLMVAIMACGSLVNVGAMERGSGSFFGATIDNTISENEDDYQITCSGLTPERVFLVPKDPTKNPVVLKGKYGDAIIRCENNENGFIFIPRDVNVYSEFENEDEIKNLEKLIYPYIIKIWDWRGEKQVSCSECFSPEHLFFLGEEEQERMKRNIYVFKEGAREREGRDNRRHFTDSTIRRLNADYFAIKYIDETGQEKEQVYPMDALGHGNFLAMNITEAIYSNGSTFNVGMLKLMDQVGMQGTDDNDFVGDLPWEDNQRTPQGMQGTDDNDFDDFLLEDNPASTPLLPLRSYVPLP